MQTVRNNEMTMNRRINPPVHKGRTIISKIKQLKRFFIVVFFVFFIGVTYAQDGDDIKEDKKKNGLAVFVGGTSNSDATAITFGLDYQYRISKLIGVGVILDYASGDIESLLIAPAIFFHISALEIALAPGAEFSNDDTSAIMRVGLSYEFEISEKFTISPSLCFDTERNLEESIVYGVAFGFKL